MHGIALSEIVISWKTGAQGFMLKTIVERVQVDNFTPDNPGPHKTLQFSIDSIKQLLPQLVKTAADYIESPQGMKPYVGRSMGSSSSMLFRGAPSDREAYRRFQR